MTLVALVGRPNVGKSTLFNRLVGKKLAIVHDTPGLTRDRRYGDASLSDLSFDLIDTPGLETTYPPTQKDSLDYSLWRQTNEAIQEANVIFFVLDGQVGVTPADEYTAQLIHKSNKPCIVIVNKSEGKETRNSLFEALKFGFKETLPFSAEHGEGLGYLYEAFAPLCEKKPEVEEQEEDPENPTISVAIVGRPNVGKSTLINQIIGQERFTTGPEAGVTRDALSVLFTWDNKPYKFIDTAGLRKKARIANKVEYLSTVETKRAIQYAEVVLLVLDGTQTLDRQDLTIAHHVVEEGRCLIFVVNKIDQITDFQKFSSEFIKDAQEMFPQIKKMPIIFVSAKEKKNLSKIFLAVQEVYKQWNCRISTAPLNEWLEKVVAHHPPPIVKNIRVKIKYITQIKRRPPTFALFINKPTDLPESYLRYLKNNLAQAFGLEKIPLRLVMRKKENPFQP
ncbi:MAG: ribosome biogenesis GTPase Der [Alphaproteobacteria bacterium]